MRLGNVKDASRTQEKSQQRRDGRGLGPEMRGRAATAEEKSAVSGGRKRQTKVQYEKIKIKLKRDSGVAKTVARVFTLACANEHLLRNLESLVAVQ